MTLLNYKDHTIEQRNIDGYVNISEMCDNHGKRLQNWRRLNKTTNKLGQISQQTGVSIDKLIVWGKRRKSYAHPLVARDCAYWISEDFGVWIDENLIFFPNTNTNTNNTHSILPTERQEELTLDIIDVPIADPDPTPESAIKAKIITEVIGALNKVVGDRDPELAQEVIRYFLFNFLDSDN